jgi:DNA-binding response OmpR family regulator
MSAALQSPREHSASAADAVHASLPSPKGAFLVLVDGDVVIAGPRERVRALAEAGRAGALVSSEALESDVENVELAVRAREGAIPARQAFGEVVVDRAAFEVFVADEKVAVTRREFLLLSYFIGNVGRLVTREALLAEVWGLRGSLRTRTVDVHVARLRGKLGHERLPIETVRRAGYRLRSPSTADATL